MGEKVEEDERQTSSKHSEPPHCFKRGMEYFYNRMIFLHRSPAHTELGSVLSFPGLYKLMKRIFIANKLSLANYSMNLISIPKSPRVCLAYE